MNLTKRRKITALITVSVVIVALVATLCVLATPSGQNAPTYFNSVEPSTPSQTVVGDSNLQISGYIPTTTNSNAVFVDCHKYDSKDGALDAGYVKVLFPSTIYLDKTESLDDAGYSFLLESYTKVGSGVNGRVFIYDNLWGYFGNSADPKPAEGDDENAMNRVFNGYGAKERYNVTDSAAVGVDAEAKKGTANTANGSGSTSTNSEMMNNTSTVKVYRVSLTGSLKDEYTGKTGIVDTYKHNNGKYVLAYYQYYKKGTFSSTWTDLVIQDTFGENSDASNYFATAGSSINGVSGYTYVSYPSIDICVYDKSELYAAIKKFDNYNFLYTMNGANTSAYDKGLAWIKGEGKQAYDNALSVFRTREVTVEQIKEATDALNAYVFELESVKDSEKNYTQSKTYDGVSITAADIHNIISWSRFDSTYFDFNFVLDGQYVSEIKDAGEYTIQVAPKNEDVRAEETLWHFRWAGDSPYAWQDLGTFTVYKANLSVANVQSNVTRPFKNSDYIVNFELIVPSSSDLSYAGSGAGIGGGTNGIFTNLYEGNTATVKVSLDEGEDKTYSPVVVLKDVDRTTVYYEASSNPNYNPYYGSFTVTITKAVLTLVFNTDNKITQAYGDIKMDSAALAATGKITVTADATEAPNWANGLIGDIFTLRVANTADYLAKGSYTILGDVNEAWQDSVNTEIKYENNEGAYVVNAKSVHITWTNTSSYYDGQTGHRSVAEVKDSELAAIDVANGVKIVPEVTLAGGLGSVTDAGTYAVELDLKNSNYTFSEAELAAGTFTIYPRPITVTLSDRNRVYGSGDVASVAWNKYIANFNSTIDVDGVFTTVLANGVNDGKAPLVDLASSVFTVKLGVTADDFTAGNSDDPAFVADYRYFKVNESGYAITLELKDTNYTLVGTVSAKFFVTPATITYDEGSFDAITYNAQDRNIAIASDKIQGSLSGYESHDMSNVTVQYSLTNGSGYASSLTLKNAGDYTVYYVITAPNHKDSRSSFTIEIKKAAVYIDFQKYEATYGDAVPTSDEIKTNLKVKFYADANKSAELSFASEISLRILATSGGDTPLPAKAVVGEYTASYVRNDVIDNYDVHYTQREGNDSNIGAYVINKKKLNIIWNTVGDGWEGTTFTYNGKTLTVEPKADPADVVAGDSITPADAEWNATPINVGTYTAKTSLSNQYNRENYEIVNPTQVFTIAQRTVSIQVKNQQAEFGNASSVPLGALINPGSASALWKYASGSLEFVDGAYTNFELTSPAKRAEGDTNYVDAGNHDITVQAIVSGSTADLNYNVVIVKDGDTSENGYNATFTIKPIDIHFSGRQYNIDVDNEPTYVTKTQIANRIALVYGAQLSEFTVEMTDLMADADGYGDKLFEDVENIEDLLTAMAGSTQTSAIDKNDTTKYGRYYIYIRITHPKNFNTFTARLEVNIQSGWFSIVIDNKIEAYYGDPTYNSQKLFDAMDITYTQVADPDTHATLTDAEALALLAGYVANGDITFFVGSGDTLTEMTVNNFGSYSIYIRVNNTAIPYQHFRFLDTNYTSGSDKLTSNIDAYVVGKRLVEVNWGDTMDEVYGSHSDDLNNPSASHDVSIANALAGDNVRLTVTYYQIVDGKRVQLPQGEHVHDVGNYVAVITGVSHDNYRIATMEQDGRVDEMEFQITPLELKIVIKDRTDLTYGAPNATRNNINTFLNVAVSEQTARRYEIYDMAGRSATFAYSDDAKDIFTFELDFSSLDAKYTYLHAGVAYTITATQHNDNYALTIEDGTLTIQKAAATSVGYTQSQVSSITYDGKEHTLIQSDILDRITLLGDGVALLNEYQKIKFEVKLSTDSDFKESNPVKDAGTYTFDIRITAPNHEVAVTQGINFTINRANVVISMSQADKVYGDTLADMLSKAGLSSDATLSDWLKKQCGITYSYSGTIEGINDDFQFIVIDSERDPDTDDNIIQLVPGTSHDVGTYRVFVDTSVTALKNYSYDFATKSGATYKCNADAYRIIQRSVAVTWKAGDDVVTSGQYKPEYTGAPVVLSAYVTDLADGQEKLLEVSGRNTNVGTGTAQVTVNTTADENKWMSNYTFTGQTFKYEIVAKTVNITINSYEVTYGEAGSRKDNWKDVNDVNRFTSDVELIGAPIRLNVAQSGSGEYFAATTYTITGTCSSNNYKVNFTNGTLTVNKANISNTDEKSYSQPYNGSDFAADIKQILKDRNYYTFVGDMTWADASVTNSNATITGVGSKVVTFTVKVANHEDISGSITIAVTQARLVINVTSGASSVYGSSLLTSSSLFNYASLDAANSSYTGVNLQNIIRLTVNVDGNKVNSGSYSFGFEWIKESDKELYDISFNDSNTTGVYVVSQKAISFTWDYDSSTRFVYNGMAHRVTGLLSGGVIAGDDVTVGYYSGNMSVNAGTFTASAEGLSGEDADNYVLGATSTLTWTVYPKEINVIWTAGDFTYNGAPHNIQKMAMADADTLISGESCDINVEVASTDNRIYAGTHTAIAVSANSNYVVSDATKSFAYEIKKAPIYITWSDAELIYNGQLQAPEALIEGNQLVASDVVNVIVDGAQREVKSSGNYTATAALDNDNYTIVSGAIVAFNISPRPITFDWEDVSTELTYTGDAIAPRPNAINKVEGDAVEFTYDGAQVNVGNGYVATVTGVASKNYVIDWKSQTATDTVEFSIGKGTNGFADPEYTVPAVLDQLPWTDANPEFKWGNDTVVVKYYSDKNLKKEVSNPANAGEGKYWIVVTVEGTENYDAYYNVFEVEVQGSLNVAIIILGSIASVMLLAGALIVVLTTNKSGKKKKQEGGAK